MKKVVRSLVASKIFRLVFSLLLLYFAFRKIDFGVLVMDLTKVPWWFVLLVLFYIFLVMVIGAGRWCYLVLDKVSWGDVLNFLRASYVGNFYSLFLSSSVGGDLLKWLPLLKKYPKLSKAKLVASVLLDRMVGFSAFCLMAFMALTVGKIIGFEFPDFLFWLFLFLSLGVIVFYVLVIFTDIEKLILKLPLGDKLIKLVEVLRSGKKKRMVGALLVSLLIQVMWTLLVWFYSSIFDAGMGLVSVYLLVPVINLILVLPVSIAGFGAREQLFLYFFSPLGLVEEKILLVSAFAGVMGVLNALLGGLLSLL